MTYGDYGFAPAPVSGGTVDASADLTAGGLALGGGDVGFAGADGPTLLGVAASLMVMSASRFGSASTGAAGSIAVKPCRVTTPASQMVAQELEARGAAAALQTAEKVRETADKYDGVIGNVRSSFYLAE